MLPGLAVWERQVLRPIPKNPLVLHNVPLHWDIPIMLFTQMSSRREAKRGFFSGDYALFSPSNFPIILWGFFPPCSTKNQWPFIFLSLYFVLEIFLMICWKLPCS